MFVGSQNELARHAGLAGASLGVVAGAVQWAFGSEIPEWTGNKLHPVQLGIITIALSAAAFASVRYIVANPGIDRFRWLVAIVVGILAPAIICFTTVGRLWYLPGPLLIFSIALLIRERAR